MPVVAVFPLHESPINHFSRQSVLDVRILHDVPGIVVIDEGVVAYGSVNCDRRHNQRDIEENEKKTGVPESGFRLLCYFGFRLGYSGTMDPRSEQYIPSLCSAILPRTISIGAKLRLSCWLRSFAALRKYCEASKLLPIAL